MHSCVIKPLRGVYMRRAALFAARYHVSVQFFAKIYFRLYERRTVLVPLRDLAIDYARSRLGGLEMFHINALKGLITWRNFSSG